MLGIPVLPRKLPSRNWMIFWTVSTTISAAIIYDRREKKRATARWAHAVEHLAREPISNPCAMPRKLTIYLSCPPGDGLRVAQDHFTEYVKPILAASGLDWEFVQGRREGDVRAVVAERLRKVRRGWDNDLEGTPEGEIPPTEDIIEAIRSKNLTPQYDGVRGDIVIGRHTWKEYIRGTHEGWLGPLSLPAEPESFTSTAPSDTPENTTGDVSGTEDADSPDKEEKPKEDKPKEEEAPPKPKFPPQPKPHNTPDDYPASHLPLLIPAELTPSAPIRQPHILGFFNTPIRMRRFFTRRDLADDIGREVAAVCFAAHREYRETADADQQPQYEQQTALDWEEKDWLKSVWKEEEKEVPAAADGAAPETPAEKIWARPVVVDPRIAMRMRRFELQPEDEARARKIVVPEEEVEGWFKSNLRQLYRWSAQQVSGGQKRTPPVGDDES